jgi:hypothetical protein
MDRSRPRPCENAQEPTRRRIVFSIALFLIAATALFLSRLTKSRRAFYAQIECLCFHTASVEPCRSIAAPRTAGIGATLSPKRVPAKVWNPTRSRPPGAGTKRQVYPVMIHCSPAKEFEDSVFHRRMKTGENAKALRLPYRGHHARGSRSLETAQQRQLANAQKS